MRSLCNFVGIAAAMLAWVPAEAASYQYTLLDVPESTFTSPAAINSFDQVAVNSSLGPAVWSNGNFSLVPMVVYLSAINDRGLAAGQVYGSHHDFASFDIATGHVKHVKVGLDGGISPITGVDSAKEFLGNVQIAGGKKTHYLGYIVSGGVTTAIVPPGAKYSATYAMNEAGAIVLGCDSFVPCVANWVYQNGAYTRFAAPRKAGQSGGIQSAFINSDTTVGGTVSYSETGLSGFVRQNGKFVIYNVPGAVDTEVTGVGPAGQVVGTFTPSGGAAHGFVFWNGAYSQLDYPGAANTYIQAISPSGSIIGGYYDANDAPHAFIAQCATGQVCTQ